MKRDERLLIAILLFVGSASAWLVQAWIVTLYVQAAVMGYWDYFSETFSVPPPAGPNEACFDYCVSDLPFAAGWTGIVSFLLALLTLAHAWWKPKS